MTHRKKSSARSKGQTGSGFRKTTTPTGNSLRTTSVNRHDHVGHMRFSDDLAVCVECEQSWDFVKDKGWIPVGFNGNGFKSSGSKPVTSKKVHDLASNKPNHMTKAERDIFERLKPKK